MTFMMLWKCVYWTSYEVRTTHHALQRTTVISHRELHLKRLMPLSIQASRGKTVATGRLNERGVHKQVPNKSSRASPLKLGCDTHAVGAF